MPEIQKEFGPGYDNWALGDTQEAATGFRNTRFDRNGNNIVTPNREAIYTYGARYDSSKRLHTLTAQNVHLLRLITTNGKISSVQV